MSRKLSIVLGIVLVLSVGGLVYAEKREHESFKAPEGNIEVNSENTSSPNIYDTGGGDTGIFHDDDEYDDDDFIGGAVSSPPPSTTPTPTLPPAQTEPSTPSGITLAQVSQHSNRSSCWSAINGSVYDLTSWIPNHPGGEGNILRICGIDGSSLFNQQHSRSNKVATILSGFKIGTLQQ